MIRADTGTGSSSDGAVEEIAELRKHGSGKAARPSE